MSTSPLSELEAVGLALAGYTCWVLADTCLKVVGASRLPVFEVIAGVGLAIVLWMTLHAFSRGTMRGLWPLAPGRQLLRSGLDLLNNLCVVIALRHLPLAMFYILVFAAPMVTTLLAAATLGERLEPRRTAAILAGFAGVVLAVNPFGVSRPGDWTGYLACLVCVCAFSVNMVWSRVLTQTESPQSLTFFSGAVMALTGLLATLLHPAPVTARLSLVMLLTGLFCVVGSLSFFVALRHAAAATVSQYHYSQLLTGTCIAYLIWHETLTPSMVAGAALIIAAGWYTAAHATRRAPVPT